jgi:predicted RND superfamily exporter protein
MVQNYSLKYRFFAVMWKNLGKWILKYRLTLLLSLTLATLVMGWYASKVQLSYDFAKAIPTDNPRYQEYLSFKQKFGEDGNLMTVGFTKNNIFQKDFFASLQKLHADIKQISGVEDVLDVTAAITLVKNDSTQKLIPTPIFPVTIKNQNELDSLRAVFLNLPFYRGLMYNAESNAWLLGIRIRKEILNSKERDKIMPLIINKTLEFGKTNNIEVHISGLPAIRSNMAVRIAKEMQFFLLGSLILSTIILFLFFRSISSTLLSLMVVVIGVIFSLGLMVLFGYKITLLNALIPPLVVVIGVPNCIYFLNKYHTSYISKEHKHDALVEMVSKMGIVTLFCNITAAIGFAVFALTKSAVLKEFGAVAGLAIMAIFFISFILLPCALSYLPAPKRRHLHYLENKWLAAILTRIELWVFSHTKMVFIISTILLLFSVVGITRLKSVGFIVDDLPQTDVIYRDLKFFEKNFEGIMPLEILIDTKKKNGLSGMKALSVFENVDAFSKEITDQPEMARPLSLVEGMKFAKQGFYDGDSNNYAIPNSFDGAFLADYLRPRKDSVNPNEGGFQKLMLAFMDSNRQIMRVSVNMADVGSKRLPIILDSLRHKADQHFDSSKYKITFTGTSITFLEGSRFIINGLRDSIIWAFILIAFCMLYLFKSVRILLASLIPNIIPLMLTAGVMGWAGIPLKPSTVLIFSVALGIAIDVTIRFLISYKQDLPNYNEDVKTAVMHTLRGTGISILYTSMVLIAGFVIFMFSGFGGTQALGFLTSLTLLTATLTNLVLLPVILLSLSKKDTKSS